MKSTIKSYVKRQGRMSEAQKRALSDATHPYLLSKQQALDLNHHFADGCPLLLDIGFGMGESLVQLANTYPECGFLGVEVYPPGVGRTLNELEKHGLDNARVIQSDIVELLPYLPQQAFDRIHLFFPDPWPKKRHHKRRLVQHEWLGALLNCLTPNGILHFATDDDDYAEHMSCVLDRMGLSIPTINPAHSNPLWAVDAKLRPPTKYAQRAKRLGHTCHDLLRCQKTG